MNEIEQILLNKNRRCNNEKNIPTKKDTKKQRTWIFKKNEY